MRNNTKSWLPDSGEYRSWIAELKRRYRVTQIKAAMSVNTALLEYYWNLGKDISERYADAAAYGMGFFDHLSADMKSAMPGADGFSPRNLRYCQRFYELYKSEEKLPQLVAELVRIPWGHHRFIIDKCSDCPLCPRPSRDAYRSFELRIEPSIAKRAKERPSQHRRA